MSHIDVMKQALEALENLIKKTSGQAIYSFMETERRIAMAACVGLREALTEQPAPAQPWVGLTVAEMEELTLLVGRMDYTRMLQLAEAKLKEKNT